MIGPLVKLLLVAMFIVVFEIPVYVEQSVAVVV